MRHTLGRIGAAIERKLDQWTMGAGVLLIVGVSAFAFALLFLPVAMLVAALLYGHTGGESEVVGVWAALGLIWGPLSVGVISKSVHNMTAPDEPARVGSTPPRRALPSEIGNN